MGKIALKPIGNIEPWILEKLSQALEATFGQAVEIKMPLGQLDHAYNPGRNQYLSTAFLDAMSDENPEERVLGICDIDLYMPRLNFVFGVADRGRKRALISLYRLRQDRYGLPRHDGLFAERAKKEAVHELGHTYGLGHCGDEGCVMHFSNSLPETDSKGALFCDHCSKKLKVRR